MPGYAESLYAQYLLALGIERQSDHRFVADELPYFPALHIEAVELGRSRRMLSSIHMMTSRLLSSVPAIKVDGVLSIEAEVIEQFISQRMNGKYGECSWIEDIQAAGCDGNALGIGVLQIGTELDDYDSPKVQVSYVEPWNTLFDGNERNLVKSPWVCFVHHMSVEEAQSHFKEAREYAFQVGSESSLPVNVVRIYEYYDQGIYAGGKKTKPTRALILGNLNSGVHKVEANPFACLPVAICTGYTNGAVNRPYGRITNEANIEAMIHLIERKFIDSLDRRNGVLYDPQSIDEDDLLAWIEGETSLVAMKQGLDKPPMFPIPQEELSSTDFHLMDYYKGSHNEQSNISDLDRGVPMSKRMTALEIQQLMSQSNSNRSLEAKQQALFLRRLFEKVLVIAKQYDRSPLVIDFKGTDVTINDPANPSLSIDKFLQNHFAVYVDAEALMSNDKTYKQAMDVAQLRELQPLVGQTINQVEYTKELLRLLGREDSKLLVEQPPSLPEQVNLQQPGQQRPEDIVREQIRGNNNR